MILKAVLSLNMKIILHIQKSLIFSEKLLDVGVSTFTN